MGPRSIVPLVAFVAVIALSCGGPTPASKALSRVARGSSPTEMPPVQRARMEARIAGVLEDAPGTKQGAVVVGTLHDGTISFFTTRPRSEGSPPADPDTLFKVCSLTKVFTGVLLAEATLRGRVRLSDEAQTYLQHVKIPRHKDGPIRVEHLATYSSGFPWQPTNFVSKAEGGYSTAAWRHFLENYTLAHAPGQGFQYGNVGFALLGDLLAEEAKVPLFDLFRTRIFEPLRMHRSGFIGDRVGDPNRAQGIDREGTPVPLDRDEPSQPASCAIETTARDLMAFLQAHVVQDGRLGSAMKLALEPRRRGEGAYDGVEMGLGWMLNSHEHRAFKTGAIEGYRSVMGMDWVRRDAVVVLAADERVDASFVMDVVFADLAVDQFAASPTVSSVPATAIPYDVKFEDGLRLVGIEAPTDVVLGSEVTVRYFFRVDQAPKHEWRSFVHADAKGERVRSDHLLSLPMRSLQPGMILEDRVNLHFRSDLKNQSFTLFDGFFRGEKRMKFEPSEEGDRIRGPRIRVVHPPDRGVAAVPSK